MKKVLLLLRSLYAFKNRKPLRADVFQGLDRIVRIALMCWVECGLSNNQVGARGYKRIPVKVGVNMTEGARERCEVRLRGNVFAVRYSPPLLLIKDGVGRRGPSTVAEENLGIERRKGKEYLKGALCNASQC